MTTYPTLSFRPDIQGLRAIAIMLVVLAHAGISVFSGGFVGVDVFFVLSGYLITGLLVREHARTGSIQIARFISRRLKRLLPTLLVMVSLIMLIAPVLISSYEFGKQAASATYAATWTSNLFFALSDFDYFSELQTRDLFLHTWSLGVEEQFYVVWPVLLLLVLSYLTRRQGRNAHHTQLLLVLAALLVGSLGLSLYWAASEPLWPFYMMPSRIWQFALGAGVFVWFDGHDQREQGVPGPGSSSRTWRMATGVSGLLLVIGSAMFMHPDLTYPGLWALLPSLGAALMIVAGNQGTVQSGNPLSHPVLVWIGDRSYSWYLWHWPVLMLGFAWGMQDRLTGTVSLVMLSLLLGAMTYRWVELPFWKGRLSHSSPSRSILLSTFAMVVVVVGALNYSDLVRLHSDERATQIANAARQDVPVIYGYGCDAWYANADVRPCVLGKSDARKTAVLLVDSIGAQWFSLFPEIFKAPEWRLVVLTKSACAMVDEDYFYSRIGKIYTVCTEWRNASLDYLKSLHPDIVIVGSAATYNFSREQWINGSARVLARLTTAADQIVVVPGTPKLSFDGPGCLTRWYADTSRKPISSNSICREALKTTQSTEVARYLEQAAQQFPNVKLLNLNDLVCPGGYCAAQDPDKIVVFRDQQHLTDSFVRAQAQSVVEKLEALGLGHVVNSVH